MRNKIKTCVSLAFLSMLILTACGSEDKVNTINDINNSSNATAPNADGVLLTAPANDVNAELSPGADVIVPEEDDRRLFRKGTWFLSQGDCGLGYMSFNDDGETGIMYDVGGGDAQDYKYSLEENSLTIKFTVNDKIASDNVEQLDEDTIMIDVENAEPYMLQYASEKTSEEFKFYSENDLLMMLQDYYVKTEGSDCPETLMKSNADMTVTIQFVNENGDSTNKSYTISTYTAEGKNDFTGESIDLKE